ncbi:MAG: GNAT family N-acetyltransferase, partial [Deinococcus sp.]|nr:GNAT family N-acetyltransferase [Deinococcus sp.]
LTTPAVRPNARGSGLREAMLAWVCARAKARGLHHMTLESWGDSNSDQSWDAGLGLTLQVRTPIYASVP